MRRQGDLGYAANWCIHYRYNRNVNLPAEDTCEAGIRYDKFVVRPCFLDDKGQSKPGALPCEHLRRPTKEEIELHEKWLEDRINLMVKVMEGIRPWRAANKGRSKAEVVKCPACSGNLHLSISGYNGHVHGRCETDGCASWME